MKLLSRPQTVVQGHLMIQMSGVPCQIPGRSHPDTIKILCPDKVKDDKDEVWSRLKYGTLIDFTLGKKIDRLVFHEEKEEIVLHGVIPIEFERSLIWEGKIVECQIDHYEINPRI